MTIESTLAPVTVGTSARMTLAAGSSTASNFNITSQGRLVVAVQRDTYFRMVPTNAPTNCTSDGTDQLLLAGNMHRIEPIPNGYKLIYNCPEGGWLHETPGS